MWRIYPRRASLRRTSHSLPGRYTTPHNATHEIHFYVTPPVSRFYSTDAGPILHRIDKIPLIHPILLERAEKFERELDAGDDSYDPENQVRVGRLAGIVEYYRSYLRETAAINDIREIISEYGDQDADMLRDAIQEAEAAATHLERTVRKLQAQLLPPPLYEENPAILELRPGVGGSEAALFTHDLMQMYINYADIQGWKYTIVLQNFSGSGQLNEAIISIDHAGAFAQLRHESGVHRVQRVPATENKGRIHTLTAAVIVLPKMSQGTESSLREDERSFAPGEVRIDTMRSGGKGGQHVNTTDSAVRLVHIPTGIIVVQQGERSQPKNKAKAFSILRARLAAREREQHMLEQRKMRTDQVTTTDRSDKIRTYNYPQNRVTDHRCLYLMHDIAGCMAGERLQEIIDRLEQNELEVRLAELNSPTK